MVSMGDGVIGFPPRKEIFEGIHQFPDCVECQPGGRGSRSRRQIGAGDINVSDLVREDLDLASLPTPRQTSQTEQNECPAKQRMSRIGDGNLTAASLGDQRGIVMVGFFPCRDCRSE